MCDTNPNIVIISWCLRYHFMIWCKYAFAAITFLTKSYILRENVYSDLYAQNCIGFWLFNCQLRCFRGERSPYVRKYAPCMSLDVIPWGVICWWDLFSEKCTRCVIGHESPFISPGEQLLFRGESFVLCFLV